MNVNAKPNDLGGGVRNTIVCYPWEGCKGGGGGRGNLALTWLSMLSFSLRCVTVF